MTSLFEFGAMEATHKLPQALVADLLDVTGSDRPSRAAVPLEFFALNFVNAAPATEVKEEKAAEAPVDAEANIARERAASVRIMIDAARQEARASALIEAEERLQSRLELERDRATSACLAFAHERRQYFAAAESQIVQLALAIARRVLSREVAADAMHLQATVRAALSRAQDDAECVLKVTPQECEAWAALFAQTQLKIVGDDRMQAGECTLDTVVGFARLGVKAQMEEVERNLLGLVGEQSR